MTTTRELTDGVFTHGQRVTAELRRYMRIGPRTRQYAGRENRNDTMIEYLIYASCHHGYFTQSTEDILRLARYVPDAYHKHVDGRRINPVIGNRILEMTPWRFSGFIGRMVNSGCTNNGEFERWFATVSEESVS